MKTTLILALILSTVGCQSNVATKTASHSCPGEGHGPCYLCDDEQPNNSRETFALMFTFLP